MDRTCGWPYLRSVFAVGLHAVGCTYGVCLRLPYLRLRLAVAGGRSEDGVGSRDREANVAVAGGDGRLVQREICQRCGNNNNKYIKISQIQN